MRRNVKRELLDWSAPVAGEKSNFRRRRRVDLELAKKPPRVNAPADARRTR
jgi:hypothetical protein